MAVRGIASRRCESLRPFVLEETCELLDAIDAGDMPAFKEELGDFLFEAVFLAELCAEAGHFTIADSVQTVTDKLIRRHPHVFTPEGEPLPKNTTITASGVKAQWDDIKKDEQAAAGKPEKTTLERHSRVVARAAPRRSALAEGGVGRASTGSAPPTSWTRSTKRCVNCGRRSLPAARRRMQAEEELGDLLFAIANLARKMGIAPGDRPSATRTTSSRIASSTWSAPPGPTACGCRTSRSTSSTQRWNAAKRHHEGTKDGTKNTK